MYYRSQSSSTRIGIARKAIDIALSDPMLSQKLANVGFGDSELQEGKQFHKKVVQLHSQKDRAYGYQIEATQALKEVAAEVRKKLLIDRRITDAVLSPAKTATLGLSGKTPESYAPLQNRASHYYNTLLVKQDILKDLAEYAFTKDYVEHRLTNVAKLITAMRTQKKCIGDAQITTTQLNQALRQLDEWMSEFIQAARFALRKDPKQLKKLGIHTTK